MNNGDISSPALSTLRRGLSLGLTALWLVLLTGAVTTLLLFYLGLMVPGFTIHEIYHYYTLALLLGFLAAVGVCLATRRTRWLFHRSARSFHLWCAAAVLSLLFLYYGLESWRGKRAWLAFVREANALGIKWDLATLAPPSVPEAEDFARIPFFAPLFEIEHKPEAQRTRLDPAVRERLSLLLLDNDYGHLPEWMYGQPISFVKYYDPALKHYNVVTSGTPPNPSRPRARETGETNRLSFAARIELLLKPYQNDLDALRQATHRSYARFPLHYERGLFDQAPHYQLLVHLNRLFSLRAVARLSLKESQEALADIQAALRLADYCAQQPALLSDTYRNRMLLTALQPIWEGLAEPRWDARQLAELQKNLETARQTDHYEQDLRVNLFYMMDFINRIVPATKPTQSVRSSPLGEDSDFWNELLLKLVRWSYPQGWSLQDQAGIGRLYLEARTLFDAPAQGLHPQQLKPLHHTFSLDLFYQIYVAPRVQEILHNAINATALGRTALDQAVLACALARYHLDNGAYPATQEMLTPHYLNEVPRDIINHQPLQYRVTPNGQFILYSVGWDEKDDGGLPRDHATGSHSTSGDWVWAYPRAEVTHTVNNP